MSSGPIFYPNVTSLPGVGSATAPAAEQPRKPGSGESEFDQVLSQVRSPLKFSAHASQRIRDRKIELDPATLMKVNQAVDQAEAKGVEDTLILTSDAALIVSVKNRTIVTAMDRGSLTGNVFTNIDGAVIV